MTKETAAAVEREEQPSTSKSSTLVRGLWWLGAGIFAIFLLQMLGSGSGDPPRPLDEKSRLRQTISTCWEQQQRKSLTPGEQRFVAGSCEILEKELWDKYHVKP